MSAASHPFCLLLWLHKRDRDSSTQKSYRYLWQHPITGMSCPGVFLPNTVRCCLHCSSFLCCHPHSNLVALCHHRATNEPANLAGYLSLLRRRSVVVHFQGNHTPVRQQMVTVTLVSSLSRVQDGKLERQTKTRLKAALARIMSTTMNRDIES